MASEVYFVRPTEYYDGFSATDFSASNGVQAVAKAVAQTVANFFIMFARGFQHTINFVFFKIHPCALVHAQERARRLPSPAPTAPPAQTKGVAVVAPTVVAAPTANVVVAEGTPEIRTRVLRTPPAPKKPGSPPPPYSAD